MRKYHLPVEYCSFLSTVDNSLKNLIDSHVKTPIRILCNCGKCQNFYEMFEVPVGCSKVMFIHGTLMFVLNPISGNSGIVTKSVHKALPGDGGGQGGRGGGQGVVGVKDGGGQGGRGGGSQGMGWWGSRGGRGLGWRLGVKGVRW